MSDHETSNGTDDPEVLQRQIVETREQLGETVEALSARLDVKQRVKDEAEELRATAGAKASEPPVQIIAAVVGVLVVALLIRRARR